MDTNNLLETLNNDERQHIHLLNYRKNDVIHLSNDQCDSIDIIVEGEVMMTKYDISGNEEVFNYLKAPSIYGNNLVFATSNFYLGDVIAVSNVKLYRIDKNNLLYLLSNNINFLNTYLSLIADKSLELSKKLQIIAIQNVDKRILSYLKMRFNEHNGIYKIKSVTNFAKEISLPRETVSRSIKRLSNAKMFIYEKNVFKEIKNSLDLI